MFTKSQVLASFLVASSVCVHALPFDALEARMFGRPPPWVTPTPGKGATGKAKQFHQVWAIEKHAENNRDHRAVQPGNTAEVHDHFHTTDGGPPHATVDYYDPNHKFVTRLHVAPDGTQLRGDEYPPAHADGYTAPHNSPYDGYQRRNIP